MSEGNMDQTSQPQANKETPPPAQAPPKDKVREALPTPKKEINHVVIRPLPKVIFFYPSCLAALVCGIWQYFIGDAALATNPKLGLTFMIVLCLNLLILSFEFSRSSTLAVMLGGAAFVFLFLYMGEIFPWDPFVVLRKFFTSLHLYASASFYFCFTGFLMFIFACIFVKTRFDYWVVTHNELLHYHGLMGNVERFPAPNLRISKEIGDVFEFLLLQSGRLIIFPASELRTIVLDNVPRVNKIENCLNELLSKIIVKTS